MHTPIPAAAPAAHPSRSAPLCCNCRHRLPTQRHALCNHPAAPVSLFDGTPEATCNAQRWSSRDEDCGRSGRWFELGPACAEPQANPFPQPDAGP